MDAKLSENDRATPMGFFMFAEAYLSSANTLRPSLTALGHQASVVRFLYFHAIELYLKAFLRSKGLSIDDLSSTRKYGHDFIKLSEKAEDLGLTLSADLSDALADFTVGKDPIEARYFRSRNGPQINPEALWLLAEEVRRAVAPDFGFYVAPPGRRIWPPA